MTANTIKAMNGKDSSEPASPSADESIEDIAFEEVIPEDSPLRKNTPAEPTIRKPSGKPVPVGQD
ncbi:hypothetical protein ABF87_11055 [Nitrosomonas sp. JL21]|uniref:hypothetical protein n=1 Tax=Nitrosomonas sp. JL21 TaxID=153949 RepID=UPI001370ECA5|nr:hypothetical protein [Nitrosomonas sp. JL21]MBL8496913.1 hypothetical protein [Nitrosomonas sp.]MCC7092522.1 hypothetical protein [Nitrosomonas sp.]MXS78487.1 hypothetical protein [Nitrosomonas sp. JL21]